MAVNIHDVMAERIRLKVFGDFAAVEISGPDMDRVTMFVAGGSTRSAADDLLEIARIGDEIARQARRAAHTRRVARRTAELAEAVAS